MIGGGIAGIQASLDIADQNFKVYLVEKTSSIGGSMARLDKTFPTNDCSICIEAPKMVEVARHPNIEVLSYSEVKDVHGRIGNFTVKVLKKPRYVDEDACTGCGLCTQDPGCIVACPVDAISKNIETGIIEIDEEACKTEVIEEGCKACIENCEYGAISIPPGYDHAVACDLCGGEPKCVDECPLDALELGIFHVNLTVNSDKCTGCRTCELVCSLEKEGVFNPRMSRIRIEEEKGTLNANICRLCKVDARCIDSCPVEALEKDENDAIQLKGLCAAKGGCTACVESCEYDAIFLPKGAEAPISCDLCGGEPKCVELCPLDAIEKVILYDGITVNRDRCTGCRTCELVCSFEKEGKFNPKKSRIYVKEEGGIPDITICELCKTCPVEVPSEFDMGIGERKVVYVPFAQASPLVYTIDRENCEICGQCDEICKRDATDAIDFSQRPEEIELNVGSVVVATGYDEFDPSAKEEYGYSIYKNVITGLQYERILSASGPTIGHILRPSDKKEPKRIAWIQCVGSRDEKCNLYCSRACCMWATKEAIITKEHDPKIETTIFYMDIRAYGKGFEEFYKRAEGEGVEYIKSRPAEVIGTEEENIVIRYEDSLTHEIEEREFDLVVLSSAIIPSSANEELSRVLRVELDENGFFKERDILSAPLETSREGVYIGGCAIGPKDIPDSISQSCGAAAKAMIPISEMRGEEIEEVELVPEKEIGEEPRIGVFVCHCGINIGGVVDVPSVVEYANALPDVVYSEEDTFTCSDDCQTRIKDAIKEHDLNRVLVAACTPRTHEPLFRGTCREAGLNKYLFEFANIREHCSWIHRHEPELATEKAKDLVRMGVAKARRIQPEEEGEFSVPASSLVIGGGIAGMTAALNLADMGFDVRLVEKQNELGGILKDLNILFPSDIPTEEVIDPKIRMVKDHERIKVHTGTEIKSIEGYIGNFDVTISENGSEDEFSVGTIVIATGSEEIDPTGYYGYERYDEVITQLQLEKLLRNDGFKEPKNVVMISCVGAREEEGRTYCCRYGCGTIIKNAKYLKNLYPDSNVFVLYRDMRVFGKKEEEYYEDVRSLGVQFVRYSKDKKPEVYKENERLIVRVYDQMLDEVIVLETDLVVLTVATEGAEDVERMSKMLKVPIGVGNFFSEAHVKLRPLDFATDGIYLCGSANFPRGINDTISQATGVASRASIPMGRGFAISEGITSVIDVDTCIMCGTCETMCPYNAIRAEDREINVITALCKGCGTCVAACPTGAIDQRHFQNEQILPVIKSVFSY